MTKTNNGVEAPGAGTQNAKPGMVTKKFRELDRGEMERALDNDLSVIAALVNFIRVNKAAKGALLDVMYEVSRNPNKELKPEEV